MAEEVEMTPVEMTPVAAAEPPKVNPLVKPPVLGAKTLKTPSPILKPGAAATVSALRPGLKLPPKPGLGTGLKLPPKPGATIGKPVIRKPGMAPTAAPLPKPVVPAGAQGGDKLPTAAPAEAAKPMEALKSVTQKLKGVTQQIPQQAILHKTGIIADSSSAAQKEAAKHKTARISLSDAMGVAPVKDEHAPMKTIRIKRPVNLPTAATTPAASDPETIADATTIGDSDETMPTMPAMPPESAAPATSVTQRKTLKITRPSARPAGKFGVKRPTAPAAAPNAAEGAPADESAVADIPDIPSTPIPPQPAAPAKTSAATVAAMIFQLAACVAIAALVWLFWENAQLPTYCGGLGWNV